MKEKNRGITLIALIITIIVMIILVGVTIITVINSGLMGHAENATARYNTEQQKEANMNSKIEVDGKVYDSIEDYLAGKEALPTIGAGERAETNSKYQTATIPAGFTVSGIAEEQSIDGGLVIYDISKGVTPDWKSTSPVGEETAVPTIQTEYNQFVWVPVETAYVTKEELAEINSNEKTALQSLADNGTYPMAVKINDTDYRGVLYDFSAGTNGVKMTVKTFSSTADYNSTSATDYREPANLAGSKTWSSAETVNGTNVTAGTSYVYDSQEMFTLYGGGTYTEDMYQKEYNAIVESVANNGGFWVARYELSYSTKGESKRGVTVANAANSSTYGWYGLYNACRNMYTTGKTKSAMIYGSQWDQMMIWMKGIVNEEATEKAGATKYYILDSSYMGNYGVATGGTGSPQVSGYSNNYQTNQVFDAGGNLQDWTTEVDGIDYRVQRGFNYSNVGSSRPASSYGASYPTVGGLSQSARSTLYVTL